MYTRNYLTVLMLILYPALVFSQDGQLTGDIASLVETERNFARASVERGIRSSFLEYFADDAIVFQPHPVKYKEAVREQPVPADPLAYILDWEPLFSDASADGDLGYNTGPYILTDNSPRRRPPQYGFFFSVWKRQDGSEWKVVLDVGIETNEAYTGSRVLKTGGISSVAGNSEARQQDDQDSLFDAENALRDSVRNMGIAAAYGERLNDDSRLHRNGLQPLLGQKEIIRYLAENEKLPEWKPMYADTARSGDLGYVYGSYQLHGSRADVILEQGYYARVWKRDPKRKWRIVLDTTSPLEPGQ